MSTPPIPIGARVHVSDLNYTGLVIVLEYNANAPGPHDTQDEWGGTLLLPSDRPVRPRHM
jgi:hypothetical protein